MHAQAVEERAGTDGVGVRITRFARLAGDVRLKQEEDWR